MKSIQHIISSCFSKRFRLAVSFGPSLILILTINLFGADPGIIISPGRDSSSIRILDPMNTGNSQHQEKDAREPVPNQLEQAKARRVIEHAYREEYAKKTSRAGKLQLAMTLLDEGRLTEDDPTGRYCMLQDARSLGIELGEPSIALNAVEELADSHRLLLLSEKLDTLKKIETTANGSTGQGEIAHAALRAMSQSIDRDDFLTAKQFRRIAETSARRSHMRDLNELLKKRVAEMDDLQEEYAKVVQAVGILQQKPEDPAANLQVGTYYSQSLGDWPRGLPMLSKSNDNLLKRLARLELDSPNDPLLQLEIADGWWNWGLQLPEGTIQRKNVLRHANEWHRRVRSRLQGLSEARVARLVQDFQTFPERRTYEEQEEDSDIVYLSDLAPSSISVSRNAFGINGRRDNGDPLKLKNRWSRKGIYPPPPANGRSSVVYELPESTFNYFRAKVGIDDAVGNRLRTPLVFELWGDYQLLWKSERIPGSGVIQSCRVKILTVRRLELKVVCEGSDEYAWPVWGDPKLTMR